MISVALSSLSCRASEIDGNKLGSKRNKNASKSPAAKAKFLRCIIKDIKFKPRYIENITLRTWRLVFWNVTPYILEEMYRYLVR